MNRTSILTRDYVHWLLVWIYPQYVLRLLQLNSVSFKIVIFMFIDMRLLVLNYPKYIGFCYLCLGICPYRHHLSKAFWTIFCKFCVFVLFSPLDWAFLIQKCQEKVCATSNSSLLWCYGEDKLPILVLTGRSTYLQLEFKVLI